MFFPHLLHFKKNDLVLEIGPGAYPHWRADCLADKFTPDDSVDLGQFGGKEMKTSGKALFKIENGKLPFKDQAFDYIICSHVLEHVDEVELPLLVSEIERVGKKSYIEFPASSYDYIYNFHVHTNFMDIVDDTIICLPKAYSRIQTVKPFTDFMFTSVRIAQNIGFEEANPEIFAAGQEFTGSIKVKIVRSPEEFFEIVTPKYSKKLPACRPSFSFWVINKINKIVSGFKKPKGAGDFSHLLK